MAKKFDFQLEPLKREFSRFVEQFAGEAHDKVQAIALDLALAGDELLRDHAESPNLEELALNVAIQAKQKAAAELYDLEDQARAEAFQIGIQTLLMAFKAGALAALA